MEEQDRYQQELLMNRRRGIRPLRTLSARRHSINEVLLERDIDHKIRRVFEAFSSRENGKLTKEKLIEAMQFVGLPVGTKEIHRLCCPGDLTKASMELANGIEVVRFIELCEKYRRKKRMGPWNTLPSFAMATQRLAHAEERDSLVDGGQ